MAVLALLSSRGNLSLQIFQAQYKICGPAGNYTGWARTDPCSSLQPQQCLGAQVEHLPSPITASKFGNLLGCLLLHLCIKAQPSKNDGRPGKKGRELESSYSIQLQSTVRGLKPTTTKGTLLHILKPFWCRKTSLHIQEKHLARKCSPAGHSIHMKSLEICKEFSSLWPGRESHCHYHPKNTPQAPGT